jgi:hypothetical protein
MYAAAAFVEAEAGVLTAPTPFEPLREDVGEVVLLRLEGEDGTEVSRGGKAEEEEAISKARVRA